MSGLQKSPLSAGLALGRADIALWVLQKIIEPKPLCVGAPFSSADVDLGRFFRATETFPPGGGRFSFGRWKHFFRPEETEKTASLVQ